jgi:hypothetical protein
VENFAEIFAKPPVLGHPHNSDNDILYPDCEKLGQPHFTIKTASIGSPPEKAGTGTHNSLPEGAKTGQSNLFCFNKIFGSVNKFFGGPPERYRDLLA